MHPFVPTPNGGKMSSHSTVTGQIWTKIVHHCAFSGPLLSDKVGKNKTGPKNNIQSKYLDACQISFLAVFDI
jgi:phage-related protein